MQTMRPTVQDLTRRIRHPAIWQAIATVPLLLLIVYSAGVIVMNDKDLRNIVAIRENLYSSQQLSQVAYALQEERGMGYMVLNANQKESKQHLLIQYQEKCNRTNEQIRKAEKELESMNQHYFLDTLTKHRDLVYRPTTTNDQPQTHLDYYTSVTQSLLRAAASLRTNTDDGQMWSLISNYDIMLLTVDLIGLQRAYGSGFFTRGGFNNGTTFTDFVGVSGSVSQFLKIFNSNEEAQLMYESELLSKENREVVSGFENGKDFLLNSTHYNARNDSGANIEMATSWFSNVTDYIDLMQKVLIRLHTSIEHRLNTELWRHKARLFYAVGTGLLIACIMMYSTVVALRYTALVRKKAIFLSAKNQQLRFERTRDDLLLYLAMPKVYKRLMNPLPPPVPTDYGCVTVALYRVEFFGDRSANLLESLSVLQRHLCAMADSKDILIVHMSSLQGMIVAGVPHDSGGHHQSVINSCATRLHGMAQDGALGCVRFRIGIATGPAIGGIVEGAAPSFCVTGPAVVRAEQLAWQAEAGETMYDVETATKLKTIAMSTSVSFVDSIKTENVSDPRSEGPCSGKDSGKHGNNELDALL